MPQDDSKYTKPALRERIKKRIMAGSKEESLTVECKERLKWLQQHIRKLVEDIKVGKERNRKT